MDCAGCGDNKATSLLLLDRVEVYEKKMNRSKLVLLLREREEKDFRSFAELDQIRRFL